MKNGKPLNKKIITIASIIIGLILIIVLAVKFNNDDTTSPDENPIIDKFNDIDKTDSIIVHDEDGSVLYEFEDENLIDIVEYVNTFDYMTFIYYETEYIINNNQTELTDTITHIVSDIDFIKNRDCTIDILKLEDNQDPFTAPRLDFTETFGFDYKKYENAFDIVMKVAKEAGVSTDFENSTPAEYNEQMYNEMYRKIYNLNNENLPIIQDIIHSIEYDKILETKCFYSTYYSDEYKGGQIEYIIATVTYTKDGKTKMREVCYTFGPHFDSLGWK